MPRRLTYTFSLFALLALLLYPGCEREIDVNLKDTDPRIVFEGWITDQPGPYEIKITRTTTYLGNTPEDLVVGATVVVKDDKGSVDTLEDMGNGIYRTGHLQGQQLTNYTMEAVVDGETYTAQNYLPRITPLLAIWSRYDDTLIFGEGYYVNILAQEPAGEGDFYQFRIWRNDSLFSSVSDLLVGDDRLVDGALAPFIYPYPHEVGDTIVTEVRGISNFTYDYFITLFQQASTGGGPFGSPPENLLTNIDNGGLGFFGTAASTRDTLIIVE